VFPVPDGLGVIEAALAEPLAVAVHAVRISPVTVGASVVVLGGGPIGLGVLQSAVAAGAGLTIVSEPSEARRAVARSCGAGAVLDPRTDDLILAVHDLTGHGVDLVFDTTGVNAALDQGIAALRPHGTLVSVAQWGERAQVDMGRAMAKEINIRFSFTYEPAVDFPISLDLLASGAVDAPGMITDHIPLDELVDRGLEELLHHSDRHVKILVDPA
jgi:(R,R)-butanediol dehydrogenase/meso-butanediol dehydrogenase/diacetyl reductase